MRNASRGVSCWTPALIPGGCHSYLSYRRFANDLVRGFCQTCGSHMQQSSGLRVLNKPAKTHPDFPLLPMPPSAGPRRFGANFTSSDPGVIRKVWFRRGAVGKPMKPTSCFPAGSAISESADGRLSNLAWSIRAIVRLFHSTPGRALTSSRRRWLKLPRQSATLLQAGYFDVWHEGLQSAEVQKWMRARGVAAEPLSESELASRTAINTSTGLGRRSRWRSTALPKIWIDGHFVADRFGRRGRFRL